MKGSMWDPRPGPGLLMSGDSMKMSPHPQLLACCLNLSYQPYLRVRWGFSEDMGLLPRGDSVHPVLGPELGQAEGKCGPGCGAVCASLACEPAAAVVFEWPTAPGTLPAASQPPATAKGTQPSSGRELR